MQLLGYVEIITLSHKPLEEWQTGFFHPFRMPLNTHDHLVFGTLYSLNHTVGGSSGDREELTRVVDGLVVERVHVEHAGTVIAFFLFLPNGFLLYRYELVAINLAEYGVWFHFHAVGDLLPVGILRVLDGHDVGLCVMLLALGGLLLDFRLLNLGKILCHMTAQRHCQRLYAATNA